MATTLNSTQQETPQTAGSAKPGTVFRANAVGVTFRERFVHERAHLLFLDCGEYDIPAGGYSSWFGAPGREALLFMWKGSARVEMKDASFDLAPYDTLYVPLGAAFRLATTRASRHASFRRRHPRRTSIRCSIRSSPSFPNARTASATCRARKST